MRIARRRVLDDGDRINCGDVMKDDHRRAGNGDVLESLDQLRRRDIRVGVAKAGGAGYAPLTTAIVVESQTESRPPWESPLGS